jgi:hypothetical protein
VTDEAAEYCRQVEAYLCSKNEGHLIRIVGPAFERVCGWSAQGVPLKIVFRGIDEYCERYYAKGGRRRPVRIEFCEADILDLFDDWRRAVGVTGGAGLEAEAPPRKPPLAPHIERVVARLTSMRAGGKWSAAFDTKADTAVRELDRLSADARRARGESRARIIEHLAALDRGLLDAVMGELPSATTVALRAEAERELAAFGARMAPDARALAVQAAFERLVREAAALPVIAYD